MLLRLIKNKIENGSRYFLVRSLPGLFDYFLVTEYPKSGGSWLGQLLSGYFDIPFPRNTFPKFGMSLVHGHYLPSKRSENIKRIFWLIRDGRDVMVSLYYHYLFLTERSRDKLKDVLYYRRKLNFKNIEEIETNLPRFIEFIFTHKPSPVFRIGHEGNWQSFNEKWQNYLLKSKGDCNLINVSYEVLLADTGKEFERIILNITGEEADRIRVKKVVDKFSFLNQSKRNPGEENTGSFLRKGIVGDWRNKFSQEAREVFDYYGGEFLIKAGYENNHNWVKMLK